MTSTPLEFRNWYKATQALSAAVQNYLDACIALESFVTIQFGSTASSVALGDKLFTAVLLEQKSVGPRKLKLACGEISVNSIYNFCKKLVPIRSLPDEIMAHIFALSFDKCTFLTLDKPSKRNRQCFGGLLNITKVCSHWRRIALNNPLLWNHIDMIDRGALNEEPGTTGLWFERANGASLAVQVSIDRDIREFDNKGSFRLMLPYFGSITLIALHHLEDDTQSLHRALEYWWAHGSPGSVKDLTVYGPHMGRNQLTYLDDTGSITQATINSFLFPVQSLRLRRALFGWRSDAYRGLKQLDISFIPDNVCPTRRNVSDIFTASPGLRFLRLYQLSIKTDPAEGVISPQNLDALHTLEIIGLLKTSMPDFFDLFRAYMTELSLAMGSRVIDKLAINRAILPSNITSLYLKTYSGGYEPGIGRHLMSLPLRNLRILTFEYIHCAGPYWRNSFFNELLPTPAGLSSNFISQWPHLHTLRIVDGPLTPDPIRQIIELYGIQTLVLSGVELCGEGCREILQASVSKLVVEGGVDMNFLDWYPRSP
ncbi:F-box-like protein [Ceratobasidium sp. AG-Ba]|nr:F-box-like protein [Ceratobasidium sp. AG-Ba]